MASAVRHGADIRLVIVKMPCPAEIELAGHAGFDGVVIDTEHGPSSGSELEHHIRAADSVGLPALVRIGAGDPSEIQGALDAGAAGIVVPRVASAAAAASIVAAAHYPPTGNRGLALTTRVGRYGTVDIQTHLSNASDTIVIVQIEDGEGVAQAHKILSLEGVDAVLIGATDLSAALGCPGEVGPKVAEAVRQIVVAAQRASVRVAEIAATPGDLDRLKERGTTIAVFVATVLIRDAFRAAARGASDS